MTETAYRQEFQSEEMKVIVHIVSVAFPEREVSNVILVSPELKEEAKMLLTLASAVPDNGFVFNTNVIIFFRFPIVLADRFGMFCCVFLRY